MPTKVKTATAKRARLGVPPRKLKSKSSAPVPESAPAVDRYWTLALCFLLAASTIFLYSPVGKYPFTHYDDSVYVTQNSHVTAGLTLNTLTWALTSTEASNWHPVTWLSHALDCQLYGLNPAGHHWTNVVIHALNTMLLFLLLWRATRARWKSLVVAALFGLHPLNVESVAWIAERKNVLSTLFFLLALGAYGWYARKPDVRRYLVVALLFVLGLAAKPMVITLPFVLMLIDYWPLQRIKGWGQPSPEFRVPQASLSRLIVEKLPLLALSAGSAIITMVAQSESEVPGLALPFGVRIETSLYAYGMYLWKAFWPAHLALIYPHPGRSLPLWQPFISALVIVIVSALAWQQRLTRPYLPVGWLWYLGTAVPIIGIVQVGVQVIADRYAYLTLIGIFVAVVWGLSELAEGSRFAVVPSGAAALILVMLAFTSRSQIGYWHSTEELWKHALQVTEGNSMAESFLANELFGLGRVEEGMVHLRNYGRVEPWDAHAHALLGSDYQDHGQLPEAIKEYEAAIAAAKAFNRLGQPGLTDSMLAMTYVNLGVSYAQLGDQDKARENMKQAAGTSAPVLPGMADSLAQYLQRNPSAQGYLRLGILFHYAGRGLEAQQAFANARQLDPGLALPPRMGSVR